MAKAVSKKKSLKEDFSKENFDKHVEDLDNIDIIPPEEIKEEVPEPEIVEEKPNIVIEATSELKKARDYAMGNQQLDKYKILLEKDPPDGSFV